MGSRLRSSVLPAVFRLPIALTIALASCPTLAQEHTTDMHEETPAPGERALVGRLRAPCCWQQTLDVHSGPMADALRAEIRKRLWAGEAASHIEADLAVRYGERVRAVAQGDPIAGVSLGIVAASLVLAGGLFMVIRRWRRAEKTKTLPGPLQASRDAYDDRLDDELRALSES